MGGGLLESQKWMIISFSLLRSFALRRSGPLWSNKQRSITKEDRFNKYPLSLYPLHSIFVKFKVKKYKYITEYYKTHLKLIAKGPYWPPLLLNKDGGLVRRMILEKGSPIELRLKELILEN